MKQNKSHPLGLPLASGEGVATPDSVSEGDTSSAVTPFDRWLVRRLVSQVGQLPVSFVLWNGETVWTPPGESVGKIIVRERAALRSLLFSPELGFGDAYSAGRIEVSGDLVTVLFNLYRAMDAIGPRAAKRGLVGRLPKPKTNTRDGSKKHIHHHYDLGNDFYRLWLDERMVYTCAYYERPDATLEEAQVAKMHHVCRKVRLKPGQTVVEAGCGWGSLALHMARHYGVRVRAFNISTEQIAFARDRAKREGLDSRVEFVEDDYRNIDERYDAFVSVGMLEHVGPDHYHALGEVVHRVLKPEGLGLIHSVGRNRPSPPNAWLEQRIFPGSYPPSLREMMDIFEPFNFSVIDVENLRLHYAKTLMEWLHRFDENLDAVLESYDEPFIRAWRLYLGGCAAAFLASTIQLFQVVFAFPNNNGIALTRGHIYGDPGQDWNLM